MLLPLALPILILVVPLADLVLAVVRRTRAGRSPFAPDKQHLHHRLLEIGHSHRRAVAIMWLWAALIAFGTVVASLYAGPTMWAAIGAMAVITLALTFLLPMVHRTRKATRFGTVRDFVIVFTSTHRCPLRDRPPLMTTAPRRPAFRPPATHVVPAFQGLSRCGSFALSSGFTRWSSLLGAAPDVLPQANESDLGGWPMMAPMQNCEVVTSSASAACSPVRSSRSRSSVSWSMRRRTPARPSRSSVSGSASFSGRSASGSGSVPRFEVEA